jgi:phospholipid-binding lipoprotein MlaA
VGLLAAGLGLAGCAGPSGPDPWVGVNRPVFGFNEGVDRFVLEPVATGWDFVLPQFAQDGVANFFDNLSMPVVFLNDVLQAKPVAAGQDVARFLVNTTAGVVGLVDVASRIGLPENDEDFGQTLGRWGVPPGPYVVLPLLGPSTVRDTLALPIDTFSQPAVWFVPTAVSVGAGTVNVVNTRAAFLEEIRENRRTALDYYVFVRNAWLQNRAKKVRDGAVEPGAEDDDDLYYLDEAEEGAEPDASE